jgi:peptide/nickel transport system substrate-binding protein
VSRFKSFARLHEYVVEQVPFVFVAHDVGPRALSPRATGLVHAKNWFQDLTPVVTK